MSGKTARYSGNSSFSLVSAGHNIYIGPFPNHVGHIGPGWKWLCSREKLQEDQIFSMGNSMVFPVDFPPFFLEMMSCLDRESTVFAILTWCLTKRLGGAWRCGSGSISHMSFWGSIGLVKGVKGKMLAGKPHIVHGKNHGFRLRFYLKPIQRSKSSKEFVLGRTSVVEDTIYFVCKTRKEHPDNEQAKRGPGMESEIGTPVKYMMYQKLSAPHISMRYIPYKSFITRLIIPWLI